MSLILDPATKSASRQLERGPFREPAALLAHALDLVEAEDDRFFRNREAINAALEKSPLQAARGESYSPEEAKALLAARRAARAA